MYLGSFSESRDPQEAGLGEAQGSEVRWEWWEWLPAFNQVVSMVWIPGEKQAQRIEVSFRSSHMAWLH